MPHYNLAIALRKNGNLSAAIPNIQGELQIDPHNEMARKMLDEAVTDALANFNLALALADRGEFDEAISRLQRELVIDPHMDDARRVLAAVNADRERLVRALHSTLDQLNERPNDISLLDWAAWVLAANPNESIRDGAQALKFAEREWKLTGGDDPRGLDTLAAAYANVGRFADAVMAERRAIQRAADGTSATQYRARLELYKAAKPSRGMR